MLELPWLDSTNTEFPSVTDALDEPNGLLAVGGDLSEQRLLAAYRNGIFPWFEDGQPILWWSPSPRAVLFPRSIHISRSLRKLLRQNIFQVSCDTQFNQVMNHCANTPRHGQLGTWITDEMLHAYQQLHLKGYAHSIEVWFESELVGGLYGIAIGKVFFGESMFSLKRDASKIALAYLAKQLDSWGFPLIDCQVSNPHLLSMGAEEIDRTHFSQLLHDNIDKSAPLPWGGTWNFDPLAETP